MKTNNRKKIAIFMIIFIIFAFMGCGYIEGKTSNIAGTTWKAVGNKTGDEITYYEEENIAVSEYIIKFEDGGTFISTRENGPVLKGEWEENKNIYHIKVFSNPAFEMEAEIQDGELILHDIVPDKYKDIPIEYAVFKQIE